jgi:hypothetical protein
VTFFVTLKSLMPSPAQRPPMDDLDADKFLRQYRKRVIAPGM